MFDFHRQQKIRWATGDLFGRWLQDSGLVEVYLQKFVQTTDCEKQKKN